MGNGLCFGNIRNVRRGENVGSGLRVGSVICGENVESGLRVGTVRM